MRDITKLIIHCTDTKEGVDIGIQDVNIWHRARGWKMVGYHYLIKLNGVIEYGRPIDMIGAHCRGHNKHSIGIAYVGGIDKDGNPGNTMTPEQNDSMVFLIESLAIVLGDMQLLGHNDLTDEKTCPNFDVGEWWQKELNS